MDRVRQPAESIRGDSLLFITKSLGVSGIHRIDLGRITGRNLKFRTPGFVIQYPYYWPIAPITITT